MNGSGLRSADDADLIERYLDRLGLSEVPPRNVDGLQQLMLAHLVAVPFENLDVYWQTPVATAADHSLAKILSRARGGWCFELNGGFASLLSALGYDVRLLGAAVVLGGPNRVVDHLTLEVGIEGMPYLVDVGFGDGFARPLPLNQRPDRKLDGLTADFGLMPSSEGTTLVRYRSDGVPEPQYRFRRVALSLSDLQPASDTLYNNPESNFRKGPLATRLTGEGLRRVTLTTDRLRFSEPAGTGTANAESTEDIAVDPGSDRWFDLLSEWFDTADHNLPTGARPA